MIYCFDIHGVLKPNKTVSSCVVISGLVKLLKIYKTLGHTIYILSGSMERRGRNEIIELGLYNYVDDIFSITDYRYAQNADQIKWKNNHPYIEDKVVWDSTKAEICLNLGVDVIFDDTLIYKDYFSDSIEFIHISNTFNVERFKTINNI